MYRSTKPSRGCISENISYLYPWWSTRTSYYGFWLAAYVYAVSKSEVRFDNSCRVKLIKSWTTLERQTRECTKQAHLILLICQSNSVIDIIQIIMFLLSVSHVAIRRKYGHGSVAVHWELYAIDFEIVSSRNIRVSTFHTFVSHMNITHQLWSVLWGEVRHLYFTYFYDNIITQVAACTSSHPFLI